MFSVYEHHSRRDREVGPAFAGSIAAPRRRRSRATSAFTLIELLVVVGIIALLLGILLPALRAVQMESRAAKCASNVRSVCSALFLYASENNGAFPPNLHIWSPGQYWYDQDRAGRYLPESDRPGSVLVCPEDPDALRSYAMNVWASSKIDDYMSKAATGYGSPWARTVGHASQLILVTETWSGVPDRAGWYHAPATVGFAGTTPGQRFGAGGGLTPPADAGRWGEVSSELAFARHRRGRRAGPTEPVGRVNIGYADGHVAMRSAGDLADFQSGRSTLDSLWSPQDPNLNE